MIKIGKTTGSLEGQKWSFQQMNTTSGIGRGNSWTFLSNNRFTATNWYSGGAYWIHDYSGKYYCNEATKTVYLKYNTSKKPFLKIEQKQQLNLKISDSDTVLVIKNGWNKPEEIVSKINVTNFFSDQIIEKWKFEIEHITAEKQ